MSGRLPEHQVDRALLTQTWTDLTFLHWRADTAAVQAALPDGLRVDVLDGSAWIGAIPFVMRDVRAVGLPAVPRWSDFPELNLRTYVHGPDGTDGVYFFSLLCPRRAFVAATRAFGLPYAHALTRVGRDGATRTYRFARRDDPRGRPTFGLRVDVGPALDAAERTPLLDSLTGRWNAYSQRAGRLLRVPVQHEAWPLHTATIQAARWSMPDLDVPTLPLGKPLVHFSPGVHARLGPPVLLPT